MDTWILPNIMQDIYKVIFFYIEFWWTVGADVLKGLLQYWRDSTEILLINIIMIIIMIMAFKNFTGDIVGQAVKIGGQVAEVAALAA